MFVLVLLLSAILTPTEQGTIPKPCPNNDCMTFTSCPEAADRAQNDKSDATKRLIQDSFCGSDNRVIKVCCSNFPPKITFDSRVMVPDSETAQRNPDTNIKGIKQDDNENSNTNINLLPDNCGDNSESRIVGGKYASLYEFPWMALISYQNDHDRQFQCSGSIINSRYILTAAHCVEGKTIAGVRVGEYIIGEDYDCERDVCEKHIQDIEVDHWVCHKKYVGYPYYEYDIALIRLREDIDFTHRNVKPICLPFSKELRNRSIANKKGTVAGWGLTEHDITSSRLLKVDIPVQAVDVCQNFYSFMSDDTTQFCAGAFQKDSCKGDSGGPLIIEGIYKGIYRFIQYGIVSNGPERCGTQSPGVYTDVRKYMDWILTVINKQ